MQVANQSISHSRLNIPRYILPIKPHHRHHSIAQNRLHFWYQKKLALDLPMFPISPQSIYQKFALILFCHTMYIFYLKLSWQTTWDNLLIFLQDPLIHLISLPSLITKHLTKLLLIQRKGLITVAKIIPIITLKPT